MRRRCCASSSLASRLRPILAGAARDGGRAELLALLSRRGYSGEDTLDRLTDFVALDIDTAILCPPDGLLLIGWCLAAPGTLARLRLRCGDKAAELRLAEAITMERGDVITALGAARGLTDPRCGFIAFAADIVAGDEPAYLQVETARREIGFKTLPPRGLRGLAAMRRILADVQVQYDEVVPALQGVVAPAIGRLQAERLRQPPAVTEITFGPPVPAPRASLVVPLYGRIDFMECQLGLLAARGGSDGTELIYVLDDPPKRRELHALADSLYQRFAIPFRLLLLDRNIGFAPASNIGLARARGVYVGFLNSDVFPGTPDWLARLIARLEADPRLGAVGPLLLFEDGSVQHEGMELEAMPALGGLRFPRHRRKGWRPRASPGLVPERLITAACLLMRRALAEELGGFDEAYVLGDFEDTDLCMKIAGRGLTCAVDHDVVLYHLERRSQEDPGRRWRSNLTLYNAWVHQCRWFAPPAEAPDA